MKTLAEADSESLQAKWFGKHELNSIDLRAHDILPLVAAGSEWAGRRYGGLPVSTGHTSSSLRLVLVAHDDDKQLVVLVGSNQGSTRFPIMEVNCYAIERSLKVSRQITMYTRPDLIN